MITDEMVEVAERTRHSACKLPYEKMRLGLEAVLPMIRAAALEEAAMWHDAEIMRLDDQIAENNAYMLRTRWTQMSFDANEACRDHQRAHRLSAAAIRAMKGTSHE